LRDAVSIRVVLELAIVMSKVVIETGESATAAEMDRGEQQSVSGPRWSGASHVRCWDHDIPVGAGVRRESQAQSLRCRCGSAYG
jgi:hypothetical protein